MSDSEKIQIVQVYSLNRMEVSNVKCPAWEAGHF
jgi:hypothetical protein